MNYPHNCRQKNKSVAQSSSEKKELSEQSDCRRCFVRGDGPCLGIYDTVGWRPSLATAGVEREWNATEIVQTASTIVRRAITQAVARSGRGSGVRGGFLRGATLVWRTICHSTHTHVHTHTKHARARRSGHVREPSRWQTRDLAHSWNLLRHPRNSSRSATPAKIIDRFIMGRNCTSGKQWTASYYVPGRKLIDIFSSVCVLVSSVVRVCQHWIILNERLTLARMRMYVFFFFDFLFVRMTIWGSIEYNLLLHTCFPYEMYRRQYEIERLREWIIYNETEIYG